jgi:hypothetical protein
MGAPWITGVIHDVTGTNPVREIILERAHGKAAGVQDPNKDPEFVPLAERIKWYDYQDAMEAA